jgi:hypothetical protein
MPGSLDEMTVALLWATSSPQARAYHARQLRWHQPAYDPLPRPRGSPAVCPVCGRAFVVAHLRHRYCHPACQRRQSQRQRYWTNGPDRARRRLGARRRTT